MLELVAPRSPPCSGTPSAAAVDPDRALQGARLRLADRGRAAQPAEPAPPALRLPATLVFDYPTPGRARRATCSPRSTGRRGRRGRPRGRAAGRRRADRDRRHGLPLPRRGRPRRRSCGELVAERRATRSPDFPGRPRLGPGAALRPGPGPAGHDLHPRGRLPARRRPSSTPSSSGSPRARRWPWTRSSGCCWRPPGRRSSGAGHRPDVAARQRDRRVRRRRCTTTTAPRAERPRGARGLPG